MRRAERNSDTLRAALSDGPERRFLSTKGRAEMHEFFEKLEGERRSLAELCGFDGDLADASELFASIISEFVTETHAFLVLDAPGDRYVQLHAHREELYAEASSNTFLDEALRLDDEAEGQLVDLGWAPPTCGWPMPKGVKDASPNWNRRWLGPVPLGTAALVIGRTLRAVFGVRRTREVGVTFFRT